MITWDKPHLDSSRSAHIKYQEAERQVQSISNEFSSHLIRIGEYQLTSHPKNIYKFRIFSSTKCVSPNIGHPLGQRREKYVLWCYQQVGPKWFASWSSSQSRDGGLSETLPRGLLRSNYSHNAGKMLSVFSPLILSWVGGEGNHPETTVTRGFLAAPMQKELWESSCLLLNRRSVIYKNIKQHHSSQLKNIVFMKKMLFMFINNELILNKLNLLNFCFTF